MRHDLWGDKPHMRHHQRHESLYGPGDSLFGRGAEAFARFFGTPLYMFIQTLLTAAWIWLNARGLSSFDPYPFILLNLFYSIQAGYAAPLILLAQTRQAQRDKASAEADAMHREELASQADAQGAQIMGLTKQVLELTIEVHKLTASLADRGAGDGKG